MNHSLFTLIQYAREELKDTYGAEEIRSICQIIFTDVFHYTNIDIHLKKSEDLDESFVKNFIKITGQLKAGQPIQYVLGETVFAGLRIELNPSTLIPRPETEELVYWIKETAPSSARILDIGTGSGCIALSLAHSLPGASVCGLDISPEAVKQARQNAQLNHLHADFMHADIFRFNTPEQYDIIISNPPYVREQEKALMQKRVLDYEPHRALFVPDDDPLIYYRTIVKWGKRHLTQGGKLFFEINEALGKEMLQLMEASGYCRLVLKKDFYGKDRFVKGELHDGL